MKRYRKPIMSRVPFIKRKSVHSRMPLIKRKPIIRRSPISSDVVNYDGCCLYQGCGCNGVNYCDVSTTFEDNSTDFRLIRLESKDYSDENWIELCKSIQFVKAQRCNIRVITDVPIPNEVLFELSYSPFNVVQYNVNLFDNEDFMFSMKSSMFKASECGLYVTLMLYPIIPEVTKTYDVLEFLNSTRFVCKTLCFKFIELDSDFPCVQGYYNINGNLVNENYMELQGNKLVCSKYFKENFCTILISYTEPRNVSCSLCNDRICY